MTSFGRFSKCEGIIIDHDGFVNLLAISLYFDSVIIYNSCAMYMM